MKSRPVGVLFCLGLCLGWCLLAPGTGSAGMYDEVWVTIQADCSVVPADPVILNAPSSQLSGTASGITMVRWKLAEGINGTAKIVPKSDAEQDTGDRVRGKRIQGMFFSRGEEHISVTAGEGVARKPTNPWDVKFQNDAVVFQYSVEIPGVCSKDPQVCVRRQGSSGCSV